MTKQKMTPELEAQLEENLEAIRAYSAARIISARIPTLSRRRRRPRRFANA